MKISIITVCYNSVAGIRNTLQSVLSQTHPDIEYIVIDGFSTDGTREIIEEYRDELAHYVSEPDHGIYDAMNKGIGLASGEIIGILSSGDVYLDRDVLSTVASEFAGGQADIVFGDLVYVHPGAPGKVVRYYSSKRFAPWKLRFGWMPPHPATFIRAGVYRELGPYRTDYRISADFEFMVRSLYCARLSFQWVAKTLVKMETGGVSTKNLVNRWRLNSEIVKACRENGVRMNLLFLVPKLPCKLAELAAARWKTTRITIR